MDLWRRKKDLWGRGRRSVVSSFSCRNAKSAASALVHDVCNYSTTVFNWSATDRNLHRCQFVIRNFQAVDGQVDLLLQGTVLGVASQVGRVLNLLNVTNIVIRTNSAATGLVATITGLLNGPVSVVLDLVFTSVVDALLSILVSILQSLILSCVLTLGITIIINFDAYIYLYRYMYIHLISGCPHICLQLGHQTNKILLQD